MDNRFIRAEEVAAELDVSKPYAYKLIRQLNEELKAKGFLTIAGRVNRQYFNERFYGTERTDADASLTKSYLHHEMDRGAKAAGVKRIRIHDLRHSHISLLIDMGFSAVAIADRVGHESIEITYRYAHLFPSKQKEMANRLDDLGKGV